MKKTLLLPIFLFIFLISLTAEDLPVIAVLDILGEGVSASESKAVTSLLVTSIHSTGLVDIIDINKREEILSEIAFSLTGCTDESCALEVGRLLAADVMVVGSLSAVGSRLAIDLKALDIETGKIIGTHYMICNNLDDVIDNIDAIGGQLVQNFTGKMAQKKEILLYEDMVPLTISCNVEGAEIFINGTSAGKIRNGLFTKALNRDITASVLVKSDGYYDYTLQTSIAKETRIDVTMDEKTDYRHALDTVCGGGTMGGFGYTLYPVPNWLGIGLWLGATLQETDPFYITSTAFLRIGSYIWPDDRSLLRLYGGGFFGTRFISYTSTDGFDFLEIRFSDNYFSGTDFHYGPYLGGEIKLTPRFRLAVETELFLNTLFFRHIYWRADIPVQIAVYGRYMLQ